MMGKALRPMMMPVLLAGLVLEAAWSQPECDESELLSDSMTYSEEDTTTTNPAGNDYSPVAGLPNQVSSTSLRNAFLNQGQTPFKQLEQSKAISTRPASSGQEIAGLSFPRSTLDVSTSAPFAAMAESTGGITRALPVRGSRVLGARYFLLNGLHLAMAGADVAFTQHCIAGQRCREGNPLMPSSLAGSISVDSALVVFGAYASRKLKLQGARLWWLVPVAGIATHGAGVATGLAHR